MWFWLPWGTIVIIIVNIYYFNPVGLLVLRAEIQHITLIASTFGRLPRLKSSEVLICCGALVGFRVVLTHPLSTTAYPEQGHGGCDAFPGWPVTRGGVQIRKSHPFITGLMLGDGEGPSPFGTLELNHFKIGECSFIRWILWVFF